MNKLINHRNTTSLLNYCQKAVNEDHSSMVEFLCNRAVNINILDDKGMTPLFVAAQAGKLKIVETLIKANADLDSIVNYRSALIAAVMNEHANIVKALLAAGANTEAKYLGMKAIEFSNSEEITNALKLFSRVPIKYILKENDDAELALASMYRLEVLPHVAKKQI